MANRAIIHTDQAPAAIGTYSQAVKVNETVYLSGQIGLDPASGELAAGGVQAELQQIFDNLQAVCRAAGGELDNLVKINVYLVDLADFGAVNDAMKARFGRHFPARAALGVSQLPRGALVEIDGVMSL